MKLEKNRAHRNQKGSNLNGLVVSRGRACQLACVNRIDSF